MRKPCLARITLIVLLASFALLGCGTSSFHDIYYGIIARGEPTFIGLESGKPHADLLTGFTIVSPPCYETLSSSILLLRSGSLYSFSTNTSQVKLVKSNFVSNNQKIEAIQSISDSGSYIVAGLTVGDQPVEPSYTYEDSYQLSLSDGKMTPVSPQINDVLRDVDNVNSGPSPFRWTRS